MNPLLTMTLSACGLLAGSANAEQPSGPEGPVAIPPTPAAQLGGAVQTAEAVPVWPVDARADRTNEARFSVLRMLMWVVQC